MYPFFLCRTGSPIPGKWQALAAGAKTWRMFAVLAKNSVGVKEFLGT